MAGGASNPAQFLIDSTPRHKGGEQIQIPTSINGTARYRQPERFSFDVKENDKLVFEVRAQRFGSPVDSILRILDQNGKEIAPKSPISKSSPKICYTPSTASSESTLPRHTKPVGRPSNTVNGGQMIPGLVV